MSCWVTHAPALIDQHFPTAEGRIILDSRPVDPWAQNDFYYRIFLDRKPIHAELQRGDVDQIYTEVGALATLVGAPPAGG